jgi:leucyl/phenylalanyl-tRNA--protein transferase
MLHNDLSPDLILNAYCNGAFPMAHHAGADAVIQFYQPDIRAVFTVDSFHIPRRLRRLLKQKQSDWRVVFPHDVLSVMTACGQQRDESWINPVLRDHYHVLAQHGFVHAIGVYEGDTLIGGLYWVQIGHAVMAESMFSRASGASKFALVSFMAALYARHTRDVHAPTWVDVQFINDHLAQFHPQEWDGAHYQSVLDSALSLSASDNFSAGSFTSSDFATDSLAAFLQFKTQMS